MKAIKRIVFAFAIVCMTSCVNTSLPQRLDNFVDDVELNANSYTAEDWEKSAIQFEHLSEQYASSEQNYSDAEKQLAARAIGRYHSLLIKNGIENASSFLKEFGAILPSYLEGLRDGLESNSEGIQNALENLFDEEKIEKSLEGLSDSIEKIFGTIDEE